jgi:hypothetical protein
VLTSWSTNAGTNPPPGRQRLELKVFRPLGFGLYTVAAHDGPRILTDGVLNTFYGLRVPVQEGDLLGLNSQNAKSVSNACYFATSGLGSGADVIATSPTGTDLADGASETFPSSQGTSRLNVAAVLTPSNVFSFAGVFYKKNGTARVFVKVPNPGTLDMSGKRVRAAQSESGSGADKVKLVVRARGGAQRRLQHTHRAGVNLSITYTPNSPTLGSGNPKTESVRIKLTKKPKRGRRR